MHYRYWFHVFQTCFICVSNVFHMCFKCVKVSFSIEVNLKKGKKLASKQSKNVHMLLNNFFLPLLTLHECSTNLFENIYYQLEAVISTPNFQIKC